MGRPTKLTSQLAEAIVEVVRSGASHEAAAKLAGIDLSTLTRWLQRGERDARGLFYDFCISLKRAEAEFEVETVERIQRASAGGELLSRAVTTRKDGTETVTETFTRPEWTAAAWLLERKWGAVWGKSDRLSVTWDMRKEAEKIAEEAGLTVEEVMAELEIMLHENA